MRARASQGFTLIELMVVVVMVGILTIMAAPAMLQAARDRRAYADSATISQLFRDARARAIGNQAAVTVTVTFGSSSDAGTLLVYQSTMVDNSSGTVRTGLGAALGTCKSPSNWQTLSSAPTGQATGAYAVLVDGASFNAAVDTEAGVTLLVNGQTSGYAAFCFTPSGQMYTYQNTSAPSVLSFSGSSTTVPQSISVKRSNRVGSIRRDIIVMPSGATRINSQVGG